jgi:hypothetical protein
MTLVAKSWSAKSPSLIHEVPASKRSVHRFKVDEKRGIIVWTTFLGGISVTDLNDRNRILWSLGSVRYFYYIPSPHLPFSDQAEVVEYAHCEYSNGFLVFNRLLEGQEVWRLASEWGDGPPIHSESLPDEEMFASYRNSKEIYGVDDLRGHFRPWALIVPPASTRAFRLVYPTLLSASAERAYLWDITTGERIQTIALTAVRDDSNANAFDEILLGRINYVELSEKHIFICSARSLRVYDRESPPDQPSLVLQIPSTKWYYGKRRYKLGVSERSPGRGGSMLVPHRMVPRYGPDAYENYSPSTRLLDMFIAGELIFHTRQCCLCLQS